MALAGVAAIAVIAGAGVAYTATNHPTTTATTSAFSATTTTSPSPGAHTPGKNHRFGRGFRGGFGGLGFGGSVQHGQFVIRKANGTEETVDVQRGTVTAVSSTSITVKSTDGYTATYAVSSDTVVDAESAGIGSVKTSDTVDVEATVSGSKATAADIRDATAVKDGRAHFSTPSTSTTS
jgi:hypothetical protein